MATLALAGPQDGASAALDELSRNFTYGALSSGNGSLSGAWYRRNQVRAGRPAPQWARARAHGAACPRPPSRQLSDAGRPKWEELTRRLHTLP